jgi:ATP-dependent RNA helicase DDX3X
MSDAGATTGVDAAAEARKLQQAEDLKRAKDAGWNDPTPFKYEAAAPEGEVEQPDNRDSAPWLSDAAVYQWDDDFGEVGESQPELEKMLFADDNIQRRGGSFNALSFEVNLEGPVKVQPVREASTSIPQTMAHC